MERGRCVINNHVCYVDNSFCSFKTVLTDYTDQILLDNLSLNVSHNISPQSQSHVDVLGYIWGAPVDKLLSAASPEGDKYDLIILSDLIFNHSQVRSAFPAYLLSITYVDLLQHDALLRTCSLTIRHPSTTGGVDPPCLLVFYSHHRPHLASRDLEFFAKAREAGWVCEKILEERFDVRYLVLSVGIELDPSCQPMFPDDPGEEEVRATVHGWKLTLS